MNSAVFARFRPFMREHARIVATRLLFRARHDVMLYTRAKFIVLHRSQGLSLVRGGRVRPTVIRTYHHLAPATHRCSGTVHAARHPPVVT